MLSPLFSLAYALIAAPSQHDRDRTAVIRNLDSPVSVAVANDYMKRRFVKNVIDVHLPDSAVSADKETITFKQFQTAIEPAMRAFIGQHPGIDFIVTTKGVPIRIADAPGLGLNNGRVSLDSFIAATNYDSALHKAAILKFEDSGFKGTAFANRYYSTDVPFTHAQFGGYLVTRLDGYTQADAIALTTRAIEAEKAHPKGEILLDTCSDFGYGDTEKQPLPIFGLPKRPGEQPPLADVEYKEYNSDMRKAAIDLKLRNVPYELDETPNFIGDVPALAGYCSWGSNDRHYDAAAYHRLKFEPGAVCETAVSTSARTFLPTTGGQSMIADLIAQGVTGAKGYCDEPLLIAVASPTLLFGHYTRGYTLAESYYAASRFVGWEDIVLGDPLCRPYPKQKTRPTKLNPRSGI
jgi:uncharacterized protein (TIGR03790 family)